MLLLLRLYRNLKPVGSNGCCGLPSQQIITTAGIATNTTGTTGSSSNTAYLARVKITTGTSICTFTRRRSVSSSGATKTNTFSTTIRRDVSRNQQHQQQRHQRQGRRQQQQQQYDHHPSYVSLKPPSIVYQNNHLLVLYKPPGWHSIPNYSHTNNKKKNQNNHNHNSNSSTGNNNSNHHHPTKYDDGDNNKCLLSYCQHQKWGGGTNQQYLKPIHRIDQPCSGIILYSKTTKGASRIQTCLMIQSSSHSSTRSSSNDHRRNKQHVSPTATKTTPAATTTTTAPTPPTPLPIQKVYYVMVRMNRSHNNSHEVTTGTWYTIHGTMLSSSPSTSSSSSSSSFQQPQQKRNTNNEGWSVRMVKSLLCSTQQQQQQQQQNCNNVNEDSSKKSLKVPPSHKKSCTLQYRFVDTYTNKKQQQDSSNVRLLQVTTHQGTRHMIRALLSCYHMDVMGDLRYGNSTNSNSTTSSRGMEALPDQSVALHAYSITMNKSIIDKTKKIKTTNKTSTTKQQQQQQQHSTMHHTDSSDTATNSIETIFDSMDMTADIVNNNINDDDDDDVITAGTAINDIPTTTTVESINDDELEEIDNSNDRRNDDDFFYWKASIPPTWSKYFHCTQAMIDTWEEQYPIYTETVQMIPI